MAAPAAASSSDSESSLGDWQERTPIERAQWRYDNYKEVFYESNFVIPAEAQALPLDHPDRLAAIEQACKKKVDEWVTSDVHSKFNGSLRNKLLWLNASDLVAQISSYRLVDTHYDRWLWTQRLKEYFIQEFGTTYKSMDDAIRTFDISLWRHLMEEAQLDLMRAKQEEKDKLSQTELADYLNGDIANMIAGMLISSDDKIWTPGGNTLLANKKTPRAPSPQAEAASSSSSSSAPTDENSSKRQKKSTQMRLAL
jgi:hypothetical protein